MHAVPKDVMPSSVPSLQPVKPNAWRRTAIALLVGALALGIALVARYYWIEPSSMGLACAAMPPPWWCAPRTGVILIHQWNGWGLAALAAGIGALIFRLYPLALIGLAAGLCGVVLYNAGLAAVGLVAALLLILRPR